MEVYSRLIKAIENDEDFKLVLDKDTQEVFDITQRVKIINAEVTSLREQEVLQSSSVNALASMRQAFQASNSGLNELDMNSLVKLKIFKNPPKVVETIAIGITIIFGLKNPSWNEYKKFASRSSFISLDMGRLYAINLCKLTPIIEEFKDNTDQLSAVSKAAYTLFTWLLSVYNWATLLQDHQPVIDNLKRVREAISEKEREIVELQSSLLNASALVQELKEKLEKLSN